MTYSPKKLLLSLLLIFSFPLLALADGGKEFSVRIYFRLNQSFYEPGLLSNEQSLDSLAAFLKTVDAKNILRANAVAYASPEGYSLVNEDLCQQRLDAVESILLTRFPQLSGKLHLRVGGEDWEQLRRSVKADKRLLWESPERYDLMNEILNDESLSNEARKVQLQTRLESNWYGYLRWIHYRYLRRVEITIVCKADEPVVAPEPQPQPEPEAQPEPQPEPQKVTEVPEQRVDPNVVLDNPKAAPKVLRPLFSVGTNALYDVLITPNISLEVPIGKRWSIFTDYTFPWWLSHENNRAWQAQKWDLGVRTWLGKRSEDPMRVLSGHFLGLDLGAGYYDIEPYHTGYQGEFVTAGLEYGYAFRLGTHWRLNLELGLGWMGTRYRRYEGNANDEKLLHQYDGWYHWFGPTKVGVEFKYIIATRRR